MRLKTKAVVRVFGVLFAITFIYSAAAGPDADDQPASAAATATNSTGAPETRYGLFNGLDHRSLYTRDVFPEPFLVDDMALEDNEIEFTWLHTKGGGQQSDTGSVEFQKGIGLLTLQVEVPYERNVSPDQTAHGIGNIALGARYPLYQFVSDHKFVDATFGVAMEGGIPVHLAVDRNAELEPQVFNCLALGGRFTAQTVRATPCFSATETTAACGRSSMGAVSVIRMRLSGHV